MADMNCKADQRGVQRQGLDLGAHGQGKKQDELLPQHAASGTIMIIGSTGFLGPYIVASLLSKRDVSEVLCVNRTSDGEHRTLLSLGKLGYDDSSRTSRLRFFVADISKANLGFSNTHVKRFATTVDAVVFNAWNPNWGLPINEFHGLLCGVQNVIDFCAASARLPRITFISSICAIGEWPRNHPERPTIPEDVIENSADAMINGYGKSKHDAEVLLKHASSRFGFHVAIVRAGQIGGPAFSTATQDMWPIQGWIYSIIKESKKKGYWPAHVQPIDWIPVDALAAGIATTTIGQWRGKAATVYNMVHPTPVPWSLLLTTLRDRYSLEVHEVGLPQWLALFKPENLKLFNFLKTAGSGREFDMVFEMDNASKVLPNVGQITVDQLELWLAGWGLNARAVQAKL
jgi:thioester reductase-like protein